MVAAKPGCPQAAHVGRGLLARRGGNPVQLPGPRGWALERSSGGRKGIRVTSLRKLPWTARYELGWRLTSWLRLMSIRATHLHTDVRIAWPVRLGPGFSLYIPDNGTFVVEEGVDFRSNFRCDIEGEGRVEIGAGTVFTANALIQCSTAVTIGKRCGFGQSTLIVDGYHRYRDHERHWAEQGYDLRPSGSGVGAGISDTCT